MDIVENVLTFWFGGMDLTRDIERKDVWFRSTPEFDRHLIENYAKRQPRRRENSTACARIAKDAWR